ncbi:MAG TPA: hypothetical protein VG817_00050 [Gemmatimonadales bacterium]|nr:hypothetical protein [Gemmatimonadales bacterium]
MSARFCRNCGTPAEAPGAAAPPPGGLSGNERLGWFMAGAVTMAVLGAVILKAGRTPVVADPEIAAPVQAPGATGAAPDISNLSPRERFDRLFNRVMRAAENGDEATVTNFSPMALSAYTMLDQVDADARYHAALIDLHTGNIDGAAALADTILTTEPGHLFGYVVRGTIARFQKNDAVLKQAYRDFLAHYPAETRRARPEYEDHARALEEFKKNAEGSR